MDRCAMTGVHLDPTLGVVADPADPLGPLVIYYLTRDGERTHVQAHRFGDATRAPVPLHQALREVIEADIKERGIES